MYTGITGKLSIGGKDIAYISNWSVEDTTDMIEVTRLGVKFKEKMPGLQGWSGSADGAVEFAQVKSDGDTLIASNQATLFKAKRDGEEVNCIFYLDVAKDVKFSGKGIIESLSIDLSAEDKGNISISISGIGKLSSPVAHS